MLITLLGYLRVLGFEKDLFKLSFVYGDFVSNDAPGRICLRVARTLGHEIYISKKNHRFLLNQRLRHSFK
jgi:hypothetical protein